MSLFTYPCNAERTRFTVSPFIDWTRFVGLVLVVLFGGVVWFALCAS